MKVHFNGTPKTKQDFETIQQFIKIVKNYQMMKELKIKMHENNKI